MKKKSFYIENLGCSKNQVDAEIFGELLMRQGLDWAEKAEQADVIIVNSCGFIRSAKEETIQETLQFKFLYPEKKVVLAGCFAQRYGKAAEKELSEVDGIIGNRDLEAMVPFIQEVLADRKPVEVPEARDAFPVRTRSLSYPGSMYVKIAEGCCNGCTYCAIPLIRGPLRSRPTDDVVREIEEYTGPGGSREIILLAQDLASFGTDRSSETELTALLEKIGNMDGDFWVRLLYIHPDHFTGKLIEACRKLGTSGSRPRVLPYFDIPFQHASPEVLKRMGRGGSDEKYLELIRRIRTELPDAVIRSTFLVGFPGEGDADFDILLRFQEAAKIDWLGVFTYSREEDTPAFALESGLKHRLGRQKAEKRKGILEQRQQDITSAGLQRFIGTRQRVLVEEKVEEAGLYIGRTYFQAPDVDGLTVIRADNLVPGSFADCIITKVTTVDLEAVLADLR